MALQYMAGTAYMVLGPFLDDTDGKTAETGLAGSMTVKFLREEAGTPTWYARVSTDAITHTEAGWYLVPLAASDSLPGPAVVKATASGALPVWREVQFVNQVWRSYLDAADVLYTSLLYSDYETEVVLDALQPLLEDANALTNLLNFFTATGYNAAASAVGSVSGSVNVASLGGSTTALTNLKKFFDGTGYNAAASSVGTVGSVTGAATANVTQLGGSATALAKLTALLAGAVTGTAVAGTLSTTEMTTNLTETTNGHWKPPNVIKWITGNLAGQARAVTGYVGSNKKLQYATATEAPAAGDQFIIL